jgi:RNA polymerase primary sigma factor
MQQRLGSREIGDQLGLTRERVRQFREKSIGKLRESGNVKNPDEISGIVEH